MHIAKAEDVVMLFMFFIVAVTNGVLTSKLKTATEDIMTDKRKAIRSRCLPDLLKDLSSGKRFRPTLWK